MEVRVCICWEIVVDGEVNTFDIDATAEDISGDTDTLVEVLEFFVAFYACGCQLLFPLRFRRLLLPFLLTDARVHRDTREVAFAQQFV